MQAPGASVRGEVPRSEPKKVFPVFEVYMWVGALDTQCAHLELGQVRSWQPVWLF